MSWTRSAAMRAGLTGAVGAALVLAVLPPPSQNSRDVVYGDEAAAAFVLSSGPLPIPQPLTADDIAATEATRDSLRASRASARADLAAQQKAAEKRKAAKAAKERRQLRADRSERRTAVPQAVSTVVGERFATTALNVRTAPDGAVITVIETGTAVSITDGSDGAWQQIRWEGSDAWVSGQYLAAVQPAAPEVSAAAPEVSAPAPAVSAPAPAQGPSGAACANGSGIEGGLSGNAIAVYRAVCARYPQITGYGGYRPDGGNHGSGRAVDVMVSGSLGWDVANWLRANAGALGISEIIYSQQIWTVQRGGEGWRSMSDRGSATANHYDHVHVSVY